MAQLKIAIAGAGGRMGLAVLRAAAANPQIAVAAALVRPGSPHLGKDVGALAGLDAQGIAVTDDIEAGLAAADALIDFTSPATSIALARRTAARKMIHVIGTTGLAPADHAAIAAAGQAGARIVEDGNFSMGMNVLANLVRQAAAALPDYDIEIVEMHHNRKVDAPSGTALLLGRAAAQGRGVDLAAQSVRVRDGHTGPRRAGTIGFATLRGGTVVGEHTVIFAGPQERVEFSHRAEDRAIFANGALAAALWARDKAPGVYAMADVLGLR